MELLSGVVLLVALLILLAGGIWIGISLFIASFLVLQFVLDVPAGLILSSSVWGFMDNWTLTALPLFILMGELLFRSDISSRIFSSLSPVVARLPGGLLHINIFGSGLFAAVSGSSTATAVTIGKMTLPELRQRGYDDRLSVGSLAASGTFGLLIPPSSLLIVYGFVAEVSIAKLFIAGILPSLLLIILFSGYVSFNAVLSGEARQQSAAREQMSLAEKLMNLTQISPLLALIAGIMVSMYGGWATATEAAALGVVGAVVLLIYNRLLTVTLVRDAMLAAVRTTCMIMFILMAAGYATAAMGFSQMPASLASWVGSFNLEAWQLIVALTIVYILLGLFLDGISMVVLTAATVMPMLQQAGIDLVWFGIYIVLVVEMSLITPPVGLNLFALQTFTGNDIFYIARSALPFFLLMVLGVALIVIIPQIVMYLPSKM